MKENYVDLNIVNKWNIQMVLQLKNAKSVKRDFIEIK